MIYFIQKGESGSIKIGYTRSDERSSIDSRLRTLQVGSDEPLNLLAAVPGGPALERKLHSAFASGRLTGEWFRPSRELLRVIYVYQEHPEFDPFDLKVKLPQAGNRSVRKRANKLALERGIANGSITVTHVSPAPAKRKRRLKSGLDGAKFPR